MKNNFALQAVLFCGVLALGEYLLHQFWFWSWDAAISQKQEQVDALKKENDLSDKYRQEREEQLRLVENARARWKTFEENIPSDFQCSQLFNDLNLAARGNVAIEDKQDTHLAYHPGLNESTVKLQTRGTFPNQMKLLWTISQLKLFVVFPQGEFRNNGDNTTTLTLNGYVPVDRPSDADTAAKKSVEALK